MRIDVVTVSPATDEVLIFRGNATGDLRSPLRMASGGDEPLVVAAGNVIGGPALDLVVGHADGSVRWLEGVGDGTFQLRQQLTVSGFDSIVDLALADGDADGATAARGPTGRRRPASRNHRPMPVIHARMRPPLLE